MNAPPLRELIRVVDLGLDEAQLTLTVWLVPLGASVTAGDRVVEILTGEAIVDLPAPVSGILAKKLVPDDSPVQPGQILGWIERIATCNNQHRE